MEYKRAQYYENLRRNVTDVIEKGVMFTIKYYPLLSSNIHLESIKNILGEMFNKQTSNNQPTTPFLPPKTPNLYKNSQPSYKIKKYHLFCDSECPSPCPLPGSQKSPTKCSCNGNCSRKNKTEYDKSDDECNINSDCEGFEIKI